LVIGGGIIGLLTAYELVQSGADVTLVEMGETGRESSWAGGGICSPLYPWRYPDAVTTLARWSRQVYPQLCADLAEQTRIDPEFTVNGLLILDTDDRDQALAWAQRHGCEVEPIDGPGVLEIEPGLGVRPAQALLMPQVANVRNPRLVKAIRRALHGRCQVREQEEVLEVLTEGGRLRGLRTTKGEIAAERAVICIGAWTARLLDGLGLGRPIEPVHGQMILFLAQPGLIRQITLYRDRYIIPRRDGRVLVGSTIEHTGFTKATTAEARESLSRAAMELFPRLKAFLIEEHWSGLRPGSPNGIPYIGACPGIAGLYVNAGHYTNGVGTGPASARLVADLLLGRDPIVDPAPYSLDAAR